MRNLPHRLHQKQTDLRNTAMNYHYVIDLPASEMDPHSVNIGPTAVDFSMLEKPPVTDNETKLLSQWKKQDLAQFYREQRGNTYSA